MLDSNIELRFKEFMNELKEIHFQQTLTNLILLNGKDSDQVYKHLQKAKKLHEMYG